MPDKKIQLPQLPKAKFIKIGEYRNAYFVLGPEDGRPLMLCHGLSANSMQFVTDAHYFADQGFRVIVPDLRGHGRSTCPDKRNDEDFSIQRLAVDLIAILDAENIEAIDWVGNSLGGILALSLMGTDRARLKKFISFGTSYRLSVPKFAVTILLGVHRLLGRNLMAKIAGPLTSKNKLGQAIVSSMIRQADIDAVGRITKHLGQYDLSAQALNFDGPMLMIQGERDKDINRALRKTLPAILVLPNFTRIKLDDAGHCANLDQPGKMRQIISDFLAD